MKSNILFGGIDCGADGAAVFLIDGKLHMFKTKTHQQVAIDFLKSLIGSNFEEIYIAIEEVAAIFGSSAKSTFEFGKRAGFWEGVMDAVSTIEHPIHLVYIKPKMWQSLLPAIDKEIKGKDRRDLRKQVSIEVANSRFPEQNITHDGVADAVNVLYYLVDLKCESFLNH